LIPVKPAQAVEAAEIVADLLRSSLEEQRDEVSLADEWRFVSRYLAMERIRFGDRLVVRDALEPAALEARLPTFALQTLIENAVRHGAAPRTSPTTIEIAAERSGSFLTVTVQNDAPARTEAEGGTGLARLRERLTVLYGNAASLRTERSAAAYRAVLVVPQARRSANA
jgi:two-component system LytT family sensor kinase